MEIIEKVKNAIALRALKREFSDGRRQKKNISIEQARHIGVLYSIPDEETYKYIFAFLKSIKTDSRSVIALGLLNEKSIPSYLNQGVYNSIITQKELNWFGKPVSPYVKNFFKEKFDVFLNISLEDHFPLTYIAALSSATFKVGKYHPGHTAYYDLMIKTEEKTSQKDFVDTMMHYIKLINQQENEQ